MTFQISFESFDKTSQIISRQTGLQENSSFITDMLGERKRGQATADYDSNTKDELSLMSYEVNFIHIYYCLISFAYLSKSISFKYICLFLGTECLRNETKEL